MLVTIVNRKRNALTTRKNREAFQPLVAFCDYLSYRLKVIIKMSNRHLFILLLLISTFLSFRKESLITNSLVGKWELKTEINGMTGKLIEYSPGNGAILVFTKNNYKTISTGKVINSGTYKVVKALS